jgi:hypothetical protein
VRSNKATRDSDLQNRTWRLNAISNGENPLGPRREGEEVRMPAIPVSPGSRGGIFNRAKDISDDILPECKKLARQVEDTIALNYGWAMPEYLGKLVPRRQELEPRVRRIVDNFVSDLGADSDPWERRFATKFGLALAAAILLTEFDIAPWTRKRARVAITAIYKRARTALVSPNEATDALISSTKPGMIPSGFAPLMVRATKRVCDRGELPTKLGILS